MTTEQIIKALMHCSSGAPLEEKCKYCPLSGHSRCRVELCEGALSIIDEQQSRNEILKKDNLRLLERLVDNKEQSNDIDDPIVYETRLGDSEVKCPYYKRSDKGKIICEGFVDNCNTVLEFKAKTKRKSYMLDNCSSIEGCENCPIHKMLDIKWEVDGIEY